MRSRTLVAMVSVVGALLATATSALAVDPVVVVDTDKPEIGPAASTTFLAWIVVNRNYDPSIRAQAIGGGTSFRVNPEGTGAFTGGIDGSTLIYERFSASEKSDLAMVDLSTRSELQVPDGVNTNAVEFSPSLSGTHLLFGRVIRRGAEIVLFDTSSAASEVVYSKAETDRREYFINPLQVNGNYAVWEQVVYSTRTGKFVSGTVFLYDIAAATTTKIPSTDPDRRWQYGASVDEEGVMYFGRSNRTFCENVQLVSRQLDGTEPILYEFRSGRDFSHSVAVDNTNNTTDVYIDRGGCRGYRDAGDIVVLRGV